MIYSHAVSLLFNNSKGKLSNSPFLYFFWKVFNNAFTGYPPSNELSAKSGRKHPSYVNNSYFVSYSSGHRDNLHRYFVNSKNGQF